MAVKTRLREISLSTLFIKDLCPDFPDYPDCPDQAIKIYPKILKYLWDSKQSNINIFFGFSVL